MKRVFSTRPMQGNYSRCMAFTAKDLEKDTPADMDYDELMDFTSGLAMHNGVWLTTDKLYGFAVHISTARGKQHQRLLCVDDVFNPTTATLREFSMETRDQKECPSGTIELIPVADMVMRYGNERYHELIDGWEEEDYPEEMVIRLLEAEFVKEDSPWGGNLFTRGSYVTLDDGTGEEQIIGKHMVFMDQSVAYVTSMGMMDHDEFRQNIIQKYTSPSSRDHVSGEVVFH